jgi:hypothetical protein
MRPGNGRASRGEPGPGVTIESRRVLDGPMILAALEQVPATIRAELGDDRSPRDRRPETRSTGTSGSDNMGPCPM